MWQDLKHEDWIPSLNLIYYATDERKEVDIRSAEDCQNQKNQSSGIGLEIWRQNAGFDAS